MEGDHQSFNLAGCLKKIVLLVRFLITHLIWIIKRYSGGMKDTYTCLAGKTAIITGGNTGLGYATSMLLASRGCRIIIATNMECEKEKNDLIKSTNNPKIISKYVDLGSFQSVRKFAEDIKKTEPKIDFLLNNAGAGILKKTITEDGLCSMMQVNYYGHFLLTHLLIDQLKAAGSARVAFVSSAASYYHNMELRDMYRTPKEGEVLTGAQYFQYYAHAKLCATAAAHELGKRLGKHGIIVTSIDPGVANTQLVQNIHILMPAEVAMGLLFRYLVFALGTDAYQVARNNVYVLTGDDVKSGQQYFQCRPIFKPHKLEDQEFCKKIWENSESIVGLKPDEKLMM